MIAQFDDCRSSLTLDDLCKFIRLRVDRTCQRKILPDQDAALITNIVKRVVFVDVPAPTPHDIAVRLAEQRKRLFIPLRVPAVERVQRHPVRTLAKDRHAVCQHLEFSVVTRHKIRLYFECTDPQVQFPHVLHLSVVQQLHLCAVKAGRAVASGPPQLRLRHPEAQFVRAELHAYRFTERAFRTRAAHLHRKPLQHRVFRCKTELQQYLRTFPVRAQRCHIHFFKICVPLWADGNAPPQPGGHKARRDIPAEHMARLAHTDHLVRVLPPRAAHAHGIIHIPGGVHRGADVHGDLIFTLPQRFCDVEPVFQHHIVRLAHCRPVQIHRRKGVHAVQAQHRAAIRQRLRRNERARVPPLVKLTGTERI